MRESRLRIGEAGSAFEHEADLIADEVMTSSAPAINWSLARIAIGAPPLERECKGGGGNECPGWGQELAPQRKTPDSAHSGRTPAILHEVLQSPGESLDPKTRAFFEAGLGYDLGHVRIHEDQAAADAAYSLAARAFTLNHHIVFGDQRYASDDRAKQHLLAHELAHTLQQSDTTPTIYRDPIPGWNFKPSDFARLQEAGVGITMASDSSFFPAKLQENLLKTIAFVLGPAIAPPATEGVNAVDFFHGHLVVKKDPKTEEQAKGAKAKGSKFQQELAAERTKALGGEVRFSKGYPLTDKNVEKYTQAVTKVLPSFGTLLDETLKMPGAAVMYHTFEFNQPSDLKAKGKKLATDDPRRHYVTPLDTNQPKQYSPPSGGYESEYTHITSFSFLVDDKGKVHARPFAPETGFTSLELSTITGTTFAKTSEFER
jgi:hypothetical protein